MFLINETLLAWLPKKPVTCILRMGSNQPQSSDEILLVPLFTPPTHHPPPPVKIVPTAFPLHRLPFSWTFTQQMSSI